MHSRSTSAAKIQNELNQAYRKLERQAVQRWSPVGTAGTTATPATLARNPWRICSNYNQVSDEREATRNAEAVLRLKLRHTSGQTNKASVLLAVGETADVSIGARLAICRARTAIGKRGIEQVGEVGDSSEINAAMQEESQPNTQQRREQQSVPRHEVENWAAAAWPAKHGTQDVDEGRSW